MTVKNINGTSDNPKCPCGSWIRHWENYSGSSRWLCAVCNCGNTATDGAHVQIKHTTSNAWFIVPMCKACNGKHGQELDIVDGVMPIAVTSRNRCKP